MEFSDIWVGSRWWSFDFHTHTPASNDYKDKDDTPEEWLLAYMKAGIDCVAVTDHNSGDWVDKLKKAYSEMQQTKPAGFRKTHIFPGVEISVHGGVHVLAILPMGKNTSDIDTLLGSVGFRGTRGASDSVTEKTINEVVDEISRCGGIAIPAHGDKEKGLFAKFQGTTLENVLNNQHIFAVETVDIANSKPPLFHDKKVAWIDVLGSDSHTIVHDAKANLPYPGKSYTWVKMEQPCIDGLRLALIDGELSIRRSDEFGQNQNIYSDMAIQKIEIDNAKYIGRGEPFTIQFNPWLNTIIGGRGSGKSTIIEFLRKTLCRDDEIPKGLDREHEKYTLVSPDYQEGLLLLNTKLQVYYWKDEAQYRVTFNNKPGSYTIEKFAYDVWEVEDGDISERFPVRIYSQKQIFDMTHNTQGLLDVINDASDVGYSNWEREFSSLKNKFFDERSRFRANVVKEEERRSVKGQISDINQKLSVFKKKGNSETLSLYGILQKQLNELNAFEKGLTDLSESISEFGQSLECPNIDETLFTSDEESRQVVSSVNEVKDSVANTISIIRKSATNIDELVEQWQGKYSKLPFNQRRLEIEKSYNKTISEMEEAGITNPSEYAELLERMQFLENKNNELDRRTNENTKLEERYTQTYMEIQIHRDEITKKRQVFIDNVLSNNESLKITVVPYGGVSESSDVLREMLFSSTDLFDKDMNPENEGNIMHLLIKGSGTIVERVKKFKKMILDVHRNKNDGSYLAKDKRFAARIQDLPASTLDKVMCWYPEDSLEIKFKDKNRDYVSLKTGSPGQKTSALLTFLLSYGDEPLVLDQPEDDIDNRWIYELIVESLRRVKTQKQVIVVTHNANIVVNADAENVITLHTPNGRTEVQSQGSLQNTDVRHSVCDVLEGGKEAFAKRFKRINI